MSSPNEKKTPEEPKRRNAQFPKQATAAEGAAAPIEEPAAVGNRGPPQYSSGEDENNDEDRRSPKPESSIYPEKDIEPRYSPCTSDREEDENDANDPPVPDGEPPNNHQVVQRLLPQRKKFFRFGWQKNYERSNISQRKSGLSQIQKKNTRATTVSLKQKIWLRVWCTDSANSTAATKYA